MKNIGKKGDSNTIWIIIFIVLAIIVLILLVFWINRSINQGKNSTEGMTQCQAQGKGAGCFAEKDFDQKVDDGFMCTKGILGCDSGGAAPYCCYKLFS